MKRHWVLWPVVANLAVLVALAFVYPTAMVSPGPLIAAHHDLATDCFGCHTPFRGAAAAKCASCHQPADIGKRTTKGIPLTVASGKTAFHQALAGRDCTACHTDHALPAFAGRPRTEFSHALLPVSVQADCASCHTAPATSFHRAPVAQCTQCHTTSRWKPASFEHGKFFALDGDHNTPCATCNVGGDTSSYTCYGCHEHQADRIAAQHTRKGIRDLANCVACHRSAKEGSEHGRKTGERRGDDDD